MKFYLIKCILKNSFCEIGENERTKQGNFPFDFKPGSRKLNYIVMVDIYDQYKNIMCKEEFNLIFIFRKPKIQLFSRAWNSGS